jgi:hypothetical protein
MDNTNTNNVKDKKMVLQDKYKQHKQLIRDCENMQARKYNDIFLLSRINCLCCLKNKF